MTFQNNIISYIKYILSRKREIAREGYAERVEIAATVSLLSFYLAVVHSGSNPLSSHTRVTFGYAFRFIVEHFSKL